MKIMNQLIVMIYVKIVRKYLIIIYMFIDFFSILIIL
jgi:hypothetical protein